jgi:hypothetical protein
MIRRRHLLYVLAALVVPLPAFGVGVGTGTPPAQALDVSVSLDQCGIASTTVVCKLDATFNSIDGARYYTAAVTGPDGNVVEYGNVSSGATSLWAPYVGDGTYSVTVSAWGENVSYGDPKPLATDSGATQNSPDGTTDNPGGHSGDRHTGVNSDAMAPGQAGSGSGGSSDTNDGSTPADPGPPACTPTPADPPPEPSDPPPDPSGDPGAPPPPDDGFTPPSGIYGVSSSTAEWMASAGELPNTYDEASNCPDPVTTPDGTCCPDVSN